MLNIFRINIMLISLTLLCTFFLYGQQGITTKMLEQMTKADSEYAARSNDEKKILPNFLFKLLRMAEEADTSVHTQQELKKMLSIKGPLHADSKDRIKVELGIRPRSAVPSVVDVIKKLDGVIEFAPGDIGDIICSVRLKHIRKLIALPSVVSIDLVTGGHHNTITSAGYTQLKADSVQLQYMAYGDNVNIGVISDGVDHRQVVEDNFELPTVHVINAGSGDEGTAMLEIIHDLAPHANLYFNTCGSSFTSLGKAISSLDSAGCRIIVDDISFYNEPYFTDEDDTLGAAIRNFLWHGGTYITAAGNENRSIYNNPDGYTIYSGTTNIEPGNMNVFPNRQTFLDCTVNPGAFQFIHFEWSTSWKHPNCDYDIYIYEDTTLVDHGDLTQSQNGDYPPRELLLVYNPETKAKSYKIIIKYRSGEISPKEFKIVCDTGGSLSNGDTDSRHVYGHHGYPGVIGVAAYNAETQNQLSYYSSGGPLKMYSTESGQWSDQQTPFITATAGVHTFVGSQSYWKYSNGTNIDPFYGTSAAAPHVAAIAALYFSEFDTRTSQDFMNDLKNGAVSIDSKGGNGNWDVRAGYGVVDAMNLFGQTLSMVATPQFNPTSKPFNTSIDVRISSATQGASIHYTTDGTPPNINSNLYNDSNPIHLTETTTVKAIAFKNGLKESSINSATFTKVTGVIFSQVDEDGKRFGWFGIMPQDHSGWNYYKYNEDVVRILTDISYIDVLASQNFKPGTIQKYHRWEAFQKDVYTNNYANVQVRSSNSGNVTEYFKSTSTANLTTALDGALTPLGTLGFKDPWIIDSTGPGYYGPLNRGIKAIWYNNLSVPVTLDTASIFKGIFLNQNTALDPNVSVYSVSAPLIKTAKVKLHAVTTYFQYWGGTNVQFQDSSATQTGVVFKAPGATAIANYKAPQLSNTSTAFQNNSQRKVVRTTDGIMHLCYESLGKAWYERSTDNGVTWAIANNGMPLSSFEAKNPSADFSYAIPGIVYQERNGDSYKIKMAYFYSNGTMFNNYDVQAKPGIIFTDSYSTNSNPVIAWRKDGRFIVVWNQAGGDSPGLYYRIGAVNYFYWGVEWQTPPTFLPGTTASSINPAVAANKASGGSNYIQIAYEENHAIKYLYCDGTNFSATQTVSTGNYPYNYNPSIIAGSDGSARVVWKGQYYPGSSSVVVFKDPGYYRFWYFGSSICTPQITLADNNSGYYVIWNEINDNSTKFTDGYSLSTIYDLNTRGQAVQLSNGFNRDSMYALTFTNNMQPFFFTTTPRIGSRDMHKDAYTSNNNIGRGGVITLDSVGFFYSIQKVQVDNQPIEFEYVADTVQIKGLKDINKYMISKPFTLSDKSDFCYSVQFGITDTLKANELLGDKSSINYVLDLIDAENDKIIGSFDGFRFDKDNCPYLKNKSYQVSTNGIGSKIVKLKLTANIINKTNNKIITEYYLISSYSDEINAIQKSGIEKVDYEGMNSIKTYSLAQNFPNPFNPSTSIYYQIPKDNYVTIKIYDILGNLIKILVNEYKSKGQYSISFDASDLASGVYFYQLNAGGFNAVKKMLLLK